MVTEDRISELLEKHRPKNLKMFAVKRQKYEEYLLTVMKNDLSNRINFVFLGEETLKDTLSVIDMMDKNIDSAISASQK